MSDQASQLAWKTHVPELPYLHATSCHDHHPVPHGQLTLLLPNQKPLGDQPCLKLRVAEKGVPLFHLHVDEVKVS